MATERNAQSEIAREQFLAERATCVGGSDIHHLVSLKPYGCVRRLFYDKTQQPADYPFEGNQATARGTACEGFAAADFEREHPGYQLADPAVPFKRLGGRHYLGVHADRIVLAEGHPFALLEIECPSARNYYAHKNCLEPPNHKKLQAIWGAGIWELDRAIVQWFSTDAWRSRFWDVDMAAERETFERLVGLADMFWQVVLQRPSARDADTIYPALPDGDRRCNSCPWRKTCKGLEDGEDEGVFLDAATGAAPLVLGCGLDEANRLLLDYVATKRLADDAATAHATVKAQLMGQFPGPGKVLLPAGKLSLTVVQKKGYQPKYVEPTTYPLFRVTPAKPEEFPDVEITEA